VKNRFALTCQYRILPSRHAPAFLFGGFGKKGIIFDLHSGQRKRRALTRRFAWSACQFQSWRLSVN
jgi:hypothetical protein